MTNRERAQAAYDDIVLAGEFVQSHDDPAGVIERAIADAVAAEREECAKVSDGMFGGVGRCIAIEIRQRGGPTP